MANDARNEISKIITTEWNRSCNELFQKTYPMIYNSSNKTEIDIDTNSVWSRVTITHKKQGQSSLADDTGRILFDNEGIVSVQCFIPTSLNNSFGLAETICTNIRNVLRRSRGCVWFRNCAATEGIREKSLQGYNVIADFTYTESLP